MNEALNRQTERLLAWLFSWRTREHAYQGYVVHRGNLKRMRLIHDTPWAQAPITEGLLNQYELSGDRRWLELALGAARLQASRFDEATGRFRWAGFEDDRFSSLVHNALAGCALLRTARLLEAHPDLAPEADELRAPVLTLARHYFLGVLYNPAIPAFRFNEVDFYAQGCERYTANMNSVALEMLLELYRVTGDEELRRVAEGVGEWLLTQEYRGAPGADGGLLYQQMVGPETGDPTLVSIYTALALRGVLALYRLTGDRRYRDLAERACRHLEAFLTPEGYYAHQFRVGPGLAQHYPSWLAGSGLIFKGLDDGAAALGLDFDYGKQLDLVLDHQLPNGAVENFFRYRPEAGEVWEDVVPIVGWNAHLFEFLSRKTRLDLDAVLGAPQPTVLRHSRNYLYLESRRLALVFGKRPYSSRGLYLVWKTLPSALLALGHGK